MWLFQPLDLLTQTDGPQLKSSRLDANVAVYFLPVPHAGSSGDVEVHSVRLHSLVIGLPCPDGYPVTLRDGIGTALTNMATKHRLMTRRPMAGPSSGNCHLGLADFRLSHSFWINDKLVTSK